MINELSRTPDIKKPNWKGANKAFATEAEAVNFVHDFWTYVLPAGDKTLQRILAHITAESLKEETVLDRTIIQDDSFDDKNEFPFRVAIYRNHDREPLTPKAIEFLQSRGIQGS